MAVPCVGGETLSEAPPRSRSFKGWLDEQSFISKLLETLKTKRTKNGRNWGYRIFLRYQQYCRCTGPLSSLTKQRNTQRTPEHPPKGQIVLCYIRTKYEALAFSTLLPSRWLITCAQHSMPFTVNRLRVRRLISNGFFFRFRTGLKNKKDKKKRRKGSTVSRNSQSTLQTRSGT